MFSTPLPRDIADCGFRRVRCWGLARLRRSPLTCVVPKRSKNETAIDGLDAIYVHENAMYRAVIVSYNPLAE
jgi:hypothetical protein